MVAFRLPPAIVFYSFGMIVAYEYRFTEYEYERRLGLWVMTRLRHIGKSTNQLFSKRRLLCGE